MTLQYIYIDHKPDPVWGKFYNKVVCKTCSLTLRGVGTSKDPWVHMAPPGVTVPEDDDLLCTECGKVIKNADDEALWLDATGKAAGPPVGDPYHVVCDPGEGER